MARHGSFSGEPRTDWLTQRKSADRDMVVVADFWFDDPRGRRWLAPAASKVDGASIPRALWSVVGSPYTGDYRRAAIVHDVTSRGKLTPARRLAADQMFYHACRAGGCGRVEATILYVGVRVGALIPDVTAWREGEADARIRATWTAPGAAERKLVGDCRWIWEKLLGASRSDDPATIERALEPILVDVIGEARVKAAKARRPSGRAG